MPSGTAIRASLARYAAAWTYLAAFIVAEIVYSLLPAQSQATVLAWASTNVHNLARDPVLPMIASAFFAGGALLAWPPLIALALFSANSVLGNWRTIATCLAGQRDRDPRQRGNPLVPDRRTARCRAPTG